MAGYWADWEEIKPELDNTPSTPGLRIRVLWLDPWFRFFFNSLRPGIICNYILKLFPLWFVRKYFYKVKKN